MAPTTCRPSAFLPTAGIALGLLSWLPDAVAQTATDNPAPQGVPEVSEQGQGGGPHLPDLHARTMR